MVKDGRLDVINIFKSIDGEAYHAGMPTIFLRTMGCNLRCVWCDTKESWNDELYAKVYGDRPRLELTVEDAVNHIVQMDRNIRHVTVTGGEPLISENCGWMQEFAIRLLSLGYEIDFETNGSVDYTEMLKWRNDFTNAPATAGYVSRVHFITDWKCPSSKMSDRMVASNLPQLSVSDIVKCVVADEDFEEVEKLLNKTSAAIYISPCFGKVRMESLPEFVLAHTEHTNLHCQLQQHKYFWDVSTKDV